jgi:uncharacterized protein YqiB (DUF1249 family)
VTRSSPAARRKGRYRVDLRALHALCEANYARLLRLFPDYEGCNTRRFSLHHARIQIDVLERSRYTTLFRVQSCRDSHPAAADASGAGSRPVNDGDRDSGSLWLSPLRMEVRAYHDAGMLEVVSFQREGRVEGRYSYPNDAMHQEDEKRQQNAFLADWLAHCLHHGEADLGAWLSRGRMPA